MSYHSIYIPFTDIYILGGPEVFKALEAKHEGQRNLVVFPSPFGKEIDPNTSKQRFVSGLQGGQDVLDFLKNIKGQKLSNHQAMRMMKDIAITKVSDDANDIMRGVAVYRVNEGLDIAYIDYANWDEGEFKVSRLEEKVRERWKADKKRPILLTNEARYHIKYDSRGMDVQDPDFLIVNSDIVNEGILTGTPELSVELDSHNGELPLEAVIDMLERDLYMHQFIRFTASQSSRGGTYRFARVVGEYRLNKSGTRILGIKEGSAKVKFLKEQEYGRQLRVGDMRMRSVLGITPRDMEQYIALQYGLLDPDVSLSFISGSQGSGKTLLAYAAAIDQVLIYEEKLRRQRFQYHGDKPVPKRGFFKQIVLLKPNDTIGGKKREVGYLPGDLFEKLKPLLEPFANAHDETILFDNNIPFTDMVLNKDMRNDFGDGRSSEGRIKGVGVLPRRAPIKIIYSGGVRGLSLRDTIMLIDEAQNFTPYEIKTLLSRLGEGCKAVLMGDVEQLDNPMCSRQVNGLTGAIQQFLHKPYSVLVNLTRNYRHQISDDTRSWKVYSK